MTYLCEPLPQSKTLVEDWKRGELIFHLQLGVGASLASGKTAKFCADLKYSPPSSEQGLSDLAVPTRHYLPPEALGQKVNGLNRAMFIEIIQVRKNDQGVKRPVPLGVSIRLSGADNCRVCAADTGQTRVPLSAASEGYLEGVSRLAHGKRDCSLLLRTQLVGPGSTSGNKRPGEVVESASVVMGDRAEAQAKPGRRRWRMIEREDESVTLRVVLTPNGVQPLKLIVIDELREFSLEKFGFSYRPAPLEPRCGPKVRV